MDARFYDPEIGRFITPDPVEFYNRISAKAVNCKRINLKSLKKEFPGISVYKR